MRIYLCHKCVKTIAGSPSSTDSSALVMITRVCIWIVPDHQFYHSLVDAHSRLYGNLGPSQCDSEFRKSLAICRDTRPTRYFLLPTWPLFDYFVRMTALWEAATFPIGNDVACLHDLADRPVINRAAVS